MAFTELQVRYSPHKILNGLTPNSAASAQMLIYRQTVVNCLGIRISEDAVAQPIDAPQSTRDLREHSWSRAPWLGQRQADLATAGRKLTREARPRIAWGIDLA